MKKLLSKLWHLNPVIIALIITALMAGVAYGAALFTVNISHTATVVPAGGGGGGGGTPIPNYTFTVTGGGISGNAIAWGGLTVGNYIDKTVTITLTGNQNITVTPDLSSVPTAILTLSALPPSVSLTPGSPSATMTLHMEGIAEGQASFTTPFNAN